MPCSSEDRYPGIMADQRREIDKLARLLCEACHIIGELPLESSEDLREWYKEHEAADARRAAEELARGEQERRKREAVKSRIENMSEDEVRRVHQVLFGP